MKRLSWIAAWAACLVTAWGVTVLPSDNPASEISESSPTPVLLLRTQPATTVNVLDTRNVGMPEASAQRDDLGTRSTSFRSYRQCLEHIDQNFQRLKSVRQIALECHSNAIYLTRVFERFAHQTPDQYLLHLKRMHAAELGGQGT
jgi:hypothetical protein